VWVANTFDGTVTQIDADTYETIGDPIDVGSKQGGAPAGIAVGEEWVFVLLEGENQLVRIDPSSGEVAGDPIEVGRSPRALDIGGDAVWVANSAGGTVSRVEG
jgi:DNA-binding beta-propeller fold protein YncE